MANSDVQICNMALAKIGESAIQSLTENSKPAKYLNIIYELERDKVLRAHEWNFATNRQKLARLSSTPAFQYDYEYQLPSDYMAVRKVYNTDVPDEVAPQVIDNQVVEVKYAIEDGKLLTNEEEIYLKYTKQVTDPNKFDASFVSAFATRLAMELAQGISANLNLRDRLEREYINEISQAFSDNSNENPEVEEEDSIFVIARR